MPNTKKPLQEVWYEEGILDAKEGITLYFECISALLPNQDKETLFLRECYKKGYREESTRKLLLGNKNERTS